MLVNSKIYKEPLQRINDYYMQIDREVKIIENSCYSKIKDSKILATKLISKLDALSPLKTLTRGYSIMEKDGKVVKSVKDITAGDDVDIRLIDGTAKAKIC